MSSHASLVAHREPQLTVHATLSKSVRRTSHPCLYLLGAALLARGDLEALKPSYVSIDCLLGLKGVAACSPSSSDPPRLPRPHLFYFHHPIRLVQMMPTHTPCHPTHTTFTGKQRVRGLLCRCFLVLTRARLSLRRPIRVHRGIHEQANMRTLSFLALVASAHAFTLPSFLGTPAERYVRGGLSRVGGGWCCWVGQTRGVRQ